MLLACPLAAWAAEPLLSPDRAEPLDLNPGVEYLPDESGQWTVDDVSKPPLAGGFKRNERAGVFIPGFTSTPYWYRLSLPPAESGPAGTWFLEVSPPYLDFVEVYSRQADGSWRVAHTGDQFPFSQRAVKHRHFMIPVDLNSERPTEIYVRVQTGGSHQFLARLWSARGLYEYSPDELASGFLLLGMLLVMAVYSACVYLLVRDRTYSDYALMLLAFGMLWALIDGTGAQYLWGEWTQLTNAIAVLVWFASTVTTGRFIQSFLETRQQAPRYHRVINLLMAAAVAAAVLGLATGYSTALRIEALLWGALNIGGLIGVIPLVRSGQRAVRFFLLAWLLPILGVPLTMAMALGWLSGSTAFFGLFRGLVGLGVVLFSLALADRFYQERRERERLRRLKRFFSPQVASAILEEGEATALAPRRRDVTVVFTDLRGFTEFSSQSEPEEVIQVLREYHEVVGQAVGRHGGTLEHFAGDGVMIFFNAPVEIPDAEACAMRMAFELREKFESLRQGWQRRGHSLGVGIGMASGFATVGAVGFEGRRDYAAIGTVTNLASRLCGQARHGQILVSQRLFAKVEALVEAEDLGEQPIKGLPKPVTVYDVRRLLGTSVAAYAAPTT